MSHEICDKTGKVKHATKKRALLYASLGKKHGSPPLRVYKCPDCHHHHLTKVPLRRPRL